jgi:hypothetical protein
MIIAFYPGAGGNRYLKMLEGSDYKMHNKSYDIQVTGQFNKNRYILEKSIDRNQPYILTHCLNVKHLQKNFPGRKIVFITADLKSCLRRAWLLVGHARFVEQQMSSINNTGRIEHYNAVKDSNWPECNSVTDIDKLPKQILDEVNADYKKITKISNNGLDKIKNNVLCQVDSCFATISWHKNYYQSYPVDTEPEDNIIQIENGTDEFCQTMQHELSLYHSEIFDLVWDSVYEQD